MPMESIVLLSLAPYTVQPVCIYKYRQIDQIRLDWIGLDQIRLDWIGLDQIGLDQIGLDWIGLGQIGLDWIG